MGLWDEVEDLGKAVIDDPVGAATAAVGVATGNPALIASGVGSMYGKKEQKKAAEDAANAANSAADQAMQAQLQAAAMQDARLREMYDRGTYAQIPARVGGNRAMSQLSAMMGLGDLPINTPWDMERTYADQAYNQAAQAPMARWSDVVQSKMPGGEAAPAPVPDMQMSPLQAPQEITARQGGGPITYKNTGRVMPGTQAPAPAPAATPAPQMVSPQTPTYGAPMDPGGAMGGGGGGKLAYLKNTHPEAYDQFVATYGGQAPAPAAPQGGQLAQLKQSNPEAFSQFQTELESGPSFMRDDWNNAIQARTREPGKLEILRQNSPEAYSQLEAAIQSPEAQAAWLTPAEQSQISTLGDRRDYLPDESQPQRSPEEAQTAAREAFKTSPGYEFRVSEGEKAIERLANARGLLGSGVEAKNMERFRQGTASQEYGNYMNQLNTMAGYGQVGNNAISNAAQGMGGQLAQVAQGMGDARTSAYLTQGQSGINAANFAGNSAATNVGQLSKLPWGDMFGGGSTAGSGSSYVFGGGGVDTQGPWSSPGGGASLYDDSNFGSFGGLFGG